MHTHMHGQTGKGSLSELQGLLGKGLPLIGAAEVLNAHAHCQTPAPHTTLFTNVAIALTDTCTECLGMHSLLPNL